MYAMAHNASSGELTVWWDTAVTGAGWKYGSGTTDGVSVTLLIPDYSSNAIKGTYADGKIKWTGNANEWNKHDTQCYPKACKAAGVCPALSLNNDRAPPLRCPKAAELETFAAAARKG
eukprot:gene7176-8478_t